MSTLGIKPALFWEVRVSVQYVRRFVLRTPTFFGSGRDK